LSRKGGRLGGMSRRQCGGRKCYRRLESIGAKVDAEKEKEKFGKIHKDHV